MQNLANAAVIGSVYLLIAVGMTMVYGLLRILHVAHAAVYTLGAFIGLVAWQAGANLWGALIAASLVAGLAGVAIYEGVYRHILDRPRIVPLIASVGLFVAASALFEQRFMFGPAPSPFRAESGLPAFDLLGIRLSSSQVTVLMVTLVLTTVLLLTLSRSGIGLDWQAIASDTNMAAASGINVRQRMILSFFVGSALAGAAGVLVGTFEGRVFADMGAVPAYKAFVVVVIGGLGSVKGAVVAAFILALLETYTIVLVGFLLPRDAIAFLILILVLMFRPHGLFGRTA